MSGSLLGPGFHPIVVHRLLLAFLVALVALTPLVAEAQDPPIRWGRLSDTEKTIDSWPDDPDASAIVLGDVGFSEVRIDGGRGVTFRLRHHKRVKVLDAEHGAARAADFRDHIGTGRKLAIQILEFFDRLGFTRRVRDDHIVLRHDMFE